MSLLNADLCIVSAERDAHAQAAWLTIVKDRRKKWISGRVKEPWGDRRSGRGESTGQQGCRDASHWPAGRDKQEN